MKETSFSLLILTAVLFLSSCSGSKKVAYFQNIDKVDLAASRGLYDAHIMPKDLLNIIVNTTDPQAAAPFNLGSGTFVGTDNQKVIGNVSALNYLVDNKGDINFPVIGKVHVGGLTKGECEDLIRNRLVPYLAKTEKFSCYSGRRSEEPGCFSCYNRENEYYRSFSTSRRFDDLW